MSSVCPVLAFQLMTEVLFGIRVIKFYNWEAYFAQKIADCRRQELSHLKAIKYLDAVCVYTWGSLPIVISIITFVTYVLLGHELTAAKVGIFHFVKLERFAFKCEQTILQSICSNVLTSNTTLYEVMFRIEHSKW